MATTLKKSISLDSPQCEEQGVIHKNVNFTNSPKHSAFLNTLLQTIIRTTPDFGARCHCTEYYKYS